MIRLHPRLTEPAVIAQLAAIWQRRRTLRLAPLMVEEDAARVQEALLSQSFSLMAPQPGEFRYQFWAASFTPEDASDPVLAAFGQWLLSEGAALCSAIVGRPLGPPADRKLLSALYTRGCYLDPHNDADGSRSVAYVVGLTRASWPAEEGGHLEFLDIERGRVVVTERRPPGWNSLDLFDVLQRHPLHQVPPLRNDHHRRVFAGWFYGSQS